MAKIVSAGMGNFSGVLIADGGRKVIREKLAKLKCPDTKIDAFFDAFDKSYASINSDLVAIRFLINEKIKGGDIVVNLHQKGRKVLTKLFAAFVVAPQFLVQSAKFSAEIHYKGGKIELWFVYDGEKTVKLSI